MVSPVVPPSSSNPKDAAGEALMVAVDEGNTDKVKRLIAGMDDREKGEHAMVLAAERGHNGALEALYERFPVAMDFAKALLAAAKNGQMDTVKYLIEVPDCDPKARDSETFRWAAGEGEMALVKILLPVSDVQADNCAAFRWAAADGHIEMVKFLLPLSDPNASGSMAMWFAAKRGHEAVIRFLIPHSDLENIKNKLVTNGYIGLDNLGQWVDETTRKAWLKEHATKMPVSAAQQVAIERERQAQHLDEKRSSSPRRRC